MRVLVAAILLGAVVGCAQVQTQINKQVDAVLELALPDLADAHAAFIASKDPTTYHDTCWTGLSTAIQAQEAADAAAGTPTTAAPAGAGLATLAETLLTTNVTAIVINLPPLPVTVKTACYATIGELRVKGTVDALKFEAAITATVRSLKL